jgi:hypothetical protein
MKIDRGIYPKPLERRFPEHPVFAGKKIRHRYTRGVGLYICYRVSSLECNRNKYLEWSTCPELCRSPLTADSPSYNNTVVTTAPRKLQHYPPKERIRPGDDVPLRLANLPTSRQVPQLRFAFRWVMKSAHLHCR